MSSSAPITEQGNFLPFLIRGIKPVTIEVSDRHVNIVESEAE